MKPEIELRFYPINKKIMRERLTRVGAIMHQPEIKMRRHLYDVENNSVNSWLRVRDEGERTTITLKENHNINRIDGIHELEMVVSDYNAACELFKRLSLKPLAYQESLRETWLLNGAMITLDTWPGLEPLMEVEGETKEQVYNAIYQLNLDPTYARKGTIKTIYMQECGYTSEEFDTMDLILSS